ncbi:hypothetical protein WDZ92_39055 [Nostoc sp. NIES-2111]
MNRDLTRARAVLLAPVLPLMRDPAAGPTVEELRFAVRKRQQEDLCLAQVFWDELIEWIDARRRGWKKKLAFYRRFVTDLARIHAAERLAWGISPDTDIFDGLRAQWKTEAMISEVMTLLREAARRANERATASESACREEPARPAEPPGRLEEREEPGLGEVPVHVPTPHEAQDAPPPEATTNVEPASRSPFGANFRPHPRPTPQSAAAMARFTRENPMIPPPPAIFACGRFASAVPTFDPYAAIQAFKRKEALAWPEQ